MLKSPPTQASALHTDGHVLAAKFVTYNGNTKREFAMLQDSEALNEKPISGSLNVELGGEGSPGWLS